MWLLGVVAAIAATVNYRQRLTALILLGAAGLAVSLMFVVFSAPDLALTQLLVEVATIALMMIVLHYLPQTSPVESGVRRKWRDAGIAGRGRHRHGRHRVRDPRRARSRPFRRSISPMRCRKAGAPTSST